MPNFRCPKCDEEMFESLKDHWRCSVHGNFNISYLIGIVHTRHKGPFHIVLTTEQINQLVDISESGIAYDIVTMAQEQGYILPIDQGDYNL